MVTRSDVDVGPFISITAELVETDRITCVA